MTGIIGNNPTRESGLVIPAAGGGKLLAIYYDTVGQRQSTTGYTPVDVTGLAITLTPASADSKFLIHSDLKGGSDTYTLNSLIVRTISGGSAAFIGLGDTTGKPYAFGMGGSSMYANLNEGTSPLGFTNSMYSSFIACTSSKDLPWNLPNKSAFSTPQ